MTPATPAAVSSLPPSGAGQAVPLARFSRPARRLLLAGAAVGAVAAWALDFGALGFGFTALVAVFALALLRVGGREGWQVAAGQRWLLFAALACAGFVTVRDNPALVGLDVLASLALCLLAARAWNGVQPIADVTLGGLFWQPLEASGRAIASGATLVSEAHQGSELGTRLRGGVGPVLRTLFIAGPVVALVTLLLASGDLSFGERLSRLTDRFFALPVSTFVRMAFVFAMVTPLSGGLVAWALRRREQPKAAEAARAPLKLGAAESFGMVLGLAAVALAYGANLTECAVDPSACVLPRGYTYAVYAHEGFAQLLIAAGLTLLVLIVVPARANLPTPGGKRAFRLASTLLVAAMMPVLATAFRRLGMYEATYGFTTERVWAQACSLFVGLMLAWRGVTLWTWPWRFGVGALAAAVTVLLGMNVFNPDDFIARRNLARPTGIVEVDRYYLSLLSADAAPALHAAGVDPARPLEDSLAGFNLARSRARSLARLPPAPPAADAGPSFGPTDGYDELDTSPRQAPAGAATQNPLQ